MHLATAMAVAALVGSALTFQSAHRAFAAVAFIASAIEVAVALGFLTMSLSGIKLPLVLAAILAVCGTILLVRSSGKAAVAGATTVTVIGTLQLLSSLRILQG